MNYLAHIYLARHSEAAMVGALLGDFVKANGWQDFPPEVGREIQLHRAVDSYTDAHPLVRSALDVFEGPRRRFGGIALDVFYDHLLSARWRAFSDEPREEFIARFYAALSAHRGLLPDPLPEFTDRMAAQDWLGAYRDFDGVELAVTRISRRLSRSGEQLRACLPDLRAHYDRLSSGFDAFFPELIAFAEEKRAQLNIS